jgi:hypothetical protein
MFACNAFSLTFAFGTHHFFELDDSGDSAGPITAGSEAGPIVVGPDAGLIAYSYNNIPLGKSPI